MKESTRLLLAVMRVSIHLKTSTKTMGYLFHEISDTKRRKKTQGMNKSEVTGFKLKYYLKPGDTCRAATRDSSN